MTTPEKKSYLQAENELNTLLITELFTPEVGGTITWFENVYRRYPKHSVWIVAQAYGDTEKSDREFFDRRISRISLKRYRFLKPESLLLYAKLLLACLWVVIRRKIGVVHAGRVLPEGYVALWIKRLLHRPYLVYAHGEEITIFSRNPAYRKIVPKVYNGASVVIANSSFTRSLLIDMGVDERRVAQVSPGVDTKVFKPAEKDNSLVARFGLSGKLVLLSVGRLTKRKGHDRVIEALPTVLSECPEVVYVIVSSGEEAATLQELAAELGVKHAVRFVGEVPYEMLPAFYNTADIFILANRTLPDGDVEGFGIVFLEANACARPVIAGVSGGTADPVCDGYNGLRIDAADPIEIANAVLKLARDEKLRKQMGENGRRLVIDKYSWEGVWLRIRKLGVAVARGEHPHMLTEHIEGKTRRS